MKTMLLCRVLLVGLMLLASPAWAALEIEISGAGETQLPVSIVPFAGEEQFNQSVSRIISDDLMRTGLFRLIDPAGRLPREPRDIRYAEWEGVEVLAIGSVNKLSDGRMEVRFRLMDVIKRSEIMGHVVSARTEQLRAVAHRIADMIYARLTGNNGVFSTRIAYVNRQGRHYRLVVADSDGYGEQTVLASNEPIMSPAWSPDGSQLAYVSFEQGRAMVFVQSLRMGQRKLLAAHPGSNSAPAWSPDGRWLALVLTRDGSSQIYRIRPDGSDLERLTYSNAIDTEPCFSPDGRYILFASDRGGSVQIYRMPAEGGPAERLTFEGRNNFSPRFSPDGKSFVFSHYNNGMFYIAVQDFDTRQMQVLTSGSWEKKPSFAPNGKLILFATEVQGRGILATVSSDGRVKQKMFSQQGDIREPMWSPFLQQ